MQPNETPSQGTEDVSVKAQEIVNASPKPPRKKLPLIIGIVGLVVLVGIGLLLAFVFSGVSQADYNKSYETAKEMSNAYSDIGRTSVSSYDSEEEAAEKYSEFSEAYTLYLEKFDALGDTKAVKKDAEAKELYDALSEKNGTLDEYYKTTGEVFEKILPLVRDISNVSSTADMSERITILKDMQNTLETLGVTQPVNVSYVDELKAALPTLISAAQEYEAKGYSAATYKKITDASTELREADSTWRDAYRNLLDDAQASTEINALGRYLTDKANGQ